MIKISESEILLNFLIIFLGAIGSSNSTGSVSTITDSSVTKNVVSALTPIDDPAMTVYFPRDASWELSSYSNEKGCSVNPNSGTIFSSFSPTVQSITVQL